MATARLGYCCIHAVTLPGAVDVLCTAHSVETVAVPHGTVAAPRDMVAACGAGVGGIAAVAVYAVEKHLRSTPKQYH